ncbi:SETMR methyltransferase, partial [Pseudoatta argentina]
MEINKKKIRYILQYYYDKGKNAAQACFARFRTGNFDVKDKLRSGRPITEKSDEIMGKVERDKHVSTVEIARELGIDHKTILNHLHKAGYKKKLDVLFLKRMITSDEKWITYNNRTRKRLWIKEEEKTQTIAKPSLITRQKLRKLGLNASTV